MVIASSILMRMRTPWRVAVTRDESADGPLTTALTNAGLIAVPCPVVSEQPPVDPAPLARAAAELESFDWAIFASRRAVAALRRARGRAWPADLLTAAVGSSTAAALREAGVAHEPVVADDSGADALWQLLKGRTWRGVRVLLPVVSGGRQTIIDGLHDAGAQVTIVEAYRMAPRSARDISADWSAARANAVVLASPSAADALIDAIGRDACASLAAIIAIGPTTAAAIRARGLHAVVSPSADFEIMADLVAHTNG